MGWIVGAIKVGLTGGICCGKSAALEIFEQHGFEAINIDRHIHDALQGNERIKLGLKGRFGDKCVDRNDGQVLTQGLADLIFNDKGAMAYVEDLLYPEVEMLWKRDSPVPSVVEVPLLFEQNLAEHFDHTLCIHATYPVQLSRAIVHRKWKPNEFDQRAAQQLPVGEKIRRADFVIGNNGTLLQFERQIQFFLETVLHRRIR